MASYVKLCQKYLIEFYHIKVKEYFYHQHWEDIWRLKTFIMNFLSVWIELDLV